MSRKFIHRRRLSVECLENRSLLAGDITATLVDGTLYLTGDDQDNDLQITQTVFNSGGTWNGVTLGVSGASRSGEITTTVNGGAGEEFEGVKNGVVIKLGRGDDFFLVNGGSKSRKPNLPGNVYVSGGPGNDDLRMYIRNNTKVAVHGSWGQDNILISGSTLNRLTLNTNSQGGTGSNVEDVIDVRATTAKGAVIINGGVGNDDVTVRARCIFDGPVIGDLGEGRDSFRFSAPSEDRTPTLNGPFMLNTGSGIDAVRATAIFRGSVDIDVGTGDDFVFYFGSVTDQPLDITLGAGDDDMNLRGVFGSGTVDGSDGEDRLSRPRAVSEELSLLNFEHVTFID